jgi:hypothetical protein
MIAKGKNIPIRLNQYLYKELYKKDFLELVEPLPEPEDLP